MVESFVRWLFGVLDAHFPVRILPTVAIGGLSLSCAKPRSNSVDLSQNKHRHNPMIDYFS